MIREPGGGAPAKVRVGGAALCSPAPYLGEGWREQRESERDPVSPARDPPRSRPARSRRPLGDAPGPPTGAVSGVQPAPSDGDPFSCGRAQRYRVCCAPRPAFSPLLKVRLE